MAASSRALLSDTHYDADATLVDSDASKGSRSEPSDNEDDFAATEQDRLVLDEVEQQEKLLEKPTRIGAVKAVFGGGRDDAGSEKARVRKRKVSSRKRQRGSIGGDAQAMFEMEEGFKNNSSQSSLDSVNLDEKRWIEGTERVCTFRFTPCLANIYSPRVSVWRFCLSASLLYSPSSVGAPINCPTMLQRCAHLKPCLTALTHSHRLQSLSPWMASVPTFSIEISRQR